MFHPDMRLLIAIDATYTDSFLVYDNGNHRFDSLPFNPRPLYQYCSTTTRQHSTLTTFRLFNTNSFRSARLLSKICLCCFFLLSGRYIHQFITFTLCHSTSQIPVRSNNKTRTVAQQSTFKQHRRRYIHTQKLLQSFEKSHHKKNKSKK